MNLSDYKYSILAKYYDGFWHYNPEWTYDSRKDAEDEISYLRKSSLIIDLCYITHKDTLPDIGCVCEWIDDELCKFSHVGNEIGRFEIIETYPPSKFEFNNGKFNKSAEPKRKCKDCIHLKLANEQYPSAMCVLCGFPVDSDGEVCISFQR